MENKVQQLIDKVNEFFSKNDIKAEAVETEGTPEKFEDVTLADGVTVATIEPAVEVGAAIVLTAEDGTAVAAPAGDYELQDGRLVVVAEEGIVAEVKEASEEIEEEPMSDDEPAKDVKRIIESIVKEKVFATEDRVKEMLEEVAKESKFAIDESATVLEKMSSLEDFVKESFTELAKLIGSEEIAEPVVEKKNSLEAFEKKENAVEAWFNKHLKQDEKV